MGQQDQANQQRKRWIFRHPFKTVVYAVLLLSVGSFVFVTFVPTRGSNLPLPDVTLQTTKMQANTSLNSSMSTTSHWDSFFLMQHIAVVNQSSHPIMQGVASGIADELAKLHGVTSVRLIDEAQGKPWPAMGQRRDDLYVVLDMPSIKESGLLVTGRTIDAQITATCGQNIWDASSHSTDQFSPPIVCIYANLKLDHKSTSTGYESANARYQCVIEDITKQLYNDLAKRLAKVASEHGKSVGIPLEMYPEYAPLPTDMPLPKDDTLKLVYSGNGLMTRNQTIWTMLSADSVAILEQMSAQLKAAHWNVSDSIHNKDHTAGYVSAYRDDCMLEVFEVLENNQRPANQPVRVVIRYFTRMSRDELRPIYEKLLNNPDTPLMTLLYLSSPMPKDQKTQVFERLLIADRLPIEAQLKAIKYLQQNKRTDEAKQRLDQISGIAILLDQTQKNEIEELGKKLTGNKKWQPPQPTAEALKAAGYLEVSNSQKQTLNVKLNEPAICWTLCPAAGKEPEHFALIICAVKTSDIPEGQYTLELKVQLGGRGNIISAHTPHNPPSPWNCIAIAGEKRRDWSAFAKQQTDGTFEITVSVTEQPQTGVNPTTTVE